VRNIAATHQDPRSLINVGRFREDLYSRLNVVPIRLPPLRERIDDIVDLARNFLRLAEREGLPRKTLSAEGIARLKEHSWPGNVRELENLMRRLAALCPDEKIPAEVIDQELTARRDGGPSDGEAAETGRTLGAAVELHLKRYFNMHGESLPPPGLYDRVLREIELPLIALTLSATRGNQLKTAELLGINRNTLRKRIRDLDIHVTRGKKLM
jgi:two-component system nitrogen regulation response regulator GlnG